LIHHPSLAALKGSLALAFNDDGWMLLFAGQMLVASIKNGTPPLNHSGGVWWWWDATITWVPQDLLGSNSVVVCP
jgi:hypothetical protein